MKRRDVIAVLAACALLASCGGGETGAPPYRYKLKAEVETPEGIRTGESVIQVQWWQGRKEAFGTQASAGFKVIGEAAAVDLPNSQFGQAELFCRAVTGAEFDGNGGNPLDGLVTVTGHSLGGALAGHVDARAPDNNYLVDPIPYAAAACALPIGEVWESSVGLVILGGPDPWDILVERFKANLNARRPALAGIAVANDNDTVFCALRAVPHHATLGGLLSCREAA